MLFLWQRNGFHGNFLKYTQDYVSLYPIYLRHIHIARLQKHIFKKNLLQFLCCLLYLKKNEWFLHTAALYLTEAISELSVDGTQ